MKDKVAGGMKGVGGEVIRKTVKTRPGREGRVGAPRAHNVEGKFGVEGGGPTGQQENRDGWKRRWR